MPDVSSAGRRAPRAQGALVLAGGAARGAYEVGVVEHVLTEVARDLGREPSLGVLCGTSVGALNACALAAFADEGVLRATRLVDIWTSLSAPSLISIDARSFFAMGARLRGRAADALASREGGLLDPTGLDQLVEREVPFERITPNLASGHVRALTVSTTHVATGRTVVFVQRREGDLPRWSFDPTIVPRAATITARHALASAAIPMLFRAVQIEGEWHCDGGLRQNVPLSPARRLGADRILVINPRYVATPTRTPAPPAAPGDTKSDDGDGDAGAGDDEAPPGPFFLLGKTLNALLLDRVDTDLARLESINRVLEAGTARYGADFVREINAQLGHPPGHGLRVLRASLVRASTDIGKMAAEYVREPAFAKRVPGLLGRVLRAIGERDARSEDDLLSYLLFDGEFAGRLIELGRADARARHDELCRFFDAE